MRAILIMSANDLRIFFSQVGNWVSLLVLPIILTVVLGIAFSGGGDSDIPALIIDIIDDDQTQSSARLLAEFRSLNDALVLCPLDSQGVDDPCDLADVPLTLATGLERLQAEESNALVLIPSGYGEAVENFTPLEIEYYSAIDPTSPDPVRQTLDAALQRINSALLTAHVGGAMLDRLAAQDGGDAAYADMRDAFVTEVYSQTETLLAQRPPAVNYVTTGGAATEDVDAGFRQSVPGTGTMYVMFTVLGGMAILLRDRKRWTLQRLGVLPLRRSQILGGKILTYFTLGMAQYAVVFAVGLLVGLDFGPYPLLLLPVMAAFALCCTALTLAIAPSMKSEGQASVTTQLLALTFASLGGAWWPLEIVPQFMQRIGYLSPVAWAMSAFHDLLFYGGGFAAILPELSVLLVATVVLFGVGIWRFHYV